MRKLLIALLVLIIVVAALLGWALYNIDSVIASYKDRIVAAAERRTGRKVAFDRIEVKVRGGIGVRIRQFSMGEDPAFGAGHFLQAADIQVNLRIHPLQREISVTRVVLHRPVVQIIRNEQGVYNFAGLGSPTAGEVRSTAAHGIRMVTEAYGAPGGQPPRPTPEETFGPGLDLAVARVEVSEGTLDYRDEKDRHYVKLGQWDLNVDDLRMDRPFKASLTGAFLSDRQNVRFDGLVGPVGPRPKVGGLPIDGSVDMTPLSWDALRRAFPRMEKAWPGALTLTGTFQSRGLSLKGKLEELRVTGTLNLTDSGLKYRDALNKPRGTVLRLEVDARATPESIVARRFEVTLDTLRVKGQGDLEFGSPAALDLSLEMAGVEIGGWHRWVPMLADYALSGRAAATAQVTVKQGAEASPRIHGTATLLKTSFKAPAMEEPVEELSAAVEFANHGATFRQLSFRIGQTRLAGKAALESFAPLTLTYRLASPSLRLADLRLQPHDAVLEDARGSGRLSWPDGLSLEGDLTSTRGRLLGLDVTDVAARFDVTGPWLAMETLRLGTLGGSLDADVRLQLGRASPRFDVAARLRGVDIRQYLAGIAGFPNVAGTINADLNVTGQGRTWDAIRPTLAGTGKAAVVEGRILDFNLAARALQGTSGVQGLASLFSGRLKERYPHIFKDQTTVFEQLDTEVEAVGDRIVVKRVTLKARDYDITGKGSVDLDGATDLDGMLTVSEDLSSNLLPGSRLTPITNDKGQLQVPFTLRGTIPDLRLKSRLRLIQTLLEKSVGRGIQGLLDLFPNVDAERPKESDKEPPEEAKDPIREIIDRTLKLFGREP